MMMCWLMYNPQTNQLADKSSSRLKPTQVSHNNFCSSSHDETFVVDVV